MDLAKFDLQAAAEEGIEVKLQDPFDGEYLVVDEGEHLTIVVLGKDSQTWQNAAKRVNTRNANRYKDRKIPNAVLEAALYEILAESKLKWSKNIELEDVALKCNKEHANIRNEQPNWVAEQLMAAAGERNNYLLK